MKKSKSPENSEITPSKKKLKQARLPFKILSDFSPTPVTPPSRKRKLSTPDPESATKVGKISNENVIVDDLVVISDEDSKDSSVTKIEKPINPYVKLVDMARQKRLRKTNGKKKKGKKAKKHNGSFENGTDSANDTSDDKDGDCEAMDVDDPKDEAMKSDTKPGDVTLNETEIPNNTPIEAKEDQSNNAVVLLEDSNNSCDINTNDKISTTVEENHKLVEPDSVKGNDIPLNENEECEVNDLNIKVLQSESAVDNSDNNMKTKEKETTFVESPITPKRSMRNRNKPDQNALETTPTSTKLNKSVNSNPSTPSNKSLSATNSLDDSVTETSAKNLTPKQLTKKLESTKKKEEREKEKLEREKKKQQEKEERARQKQEKEDQKKKEKEEKEEQKKKEKEEKERQKELEKKKEEKEEQRRKEKEEKEEQKRKEKEAREEERKKKQEALELEKQEQELKKKKAAEAFANFFVSKQKSEKDQAIIGTVNTNMLSSFALKSDMRIAPTVRREFNDENRQNFDNIVEKQNISKSELYLDTLKSRKNKPMFSGKTWPLTDKDDDDDVMIIEDELPSIDCVGEIVTCEPVVREKLRPKLLSFYENRRPPYWGTWRKKSTFVKPRKPFGQDGKQLDYEVDSDEEWEEEEGESIDGSAAGSDDEQEGDEYEVDNEVFVPHGYLSDEEATMDEDDVLSLSPETQKAKLKHLEDEFESEMKKPTEKLKPRLYGLLWETKDGKPDKCVDALWNYFGKLSMVLNDPTPLLQPSNEPEETEKKKVKKKKVVDGEQKSPKSDKKKVKSEEKESKKVKSDTRKPVSDIKKNQPGINAFLSKVKST
ncbi:hypothetical protein K1T71_009250 [Dendrolimus kikuchii]|uniref:Uncharacterized protein n=1 Tax=Dendrolimus kikuchii TaxID=765133 RepID=A0ACC1CTU8_9NEOP|nr:hypothetical protein K1T71_009250 [Dendrolimus kikuchii]